MGNLCSSTAANTGASLRNLVGIYRKRLRSKFSNSTSLVNRQAAKEKNTCRECISSAISILAMADGSDFNGVIVFQIEEDPVIAAAETEAGEWRLQFFYITGTAGEVAVQAIKNLNGWFAVDGSKIGAGFWGSVDRDALRRRGFGHFFRPNSRRISS